MSEFTVDPQSLAAFANTLNALGPVMEQLKSVSQQDTGQIGGHEIESAVSSFANTWKYGAGQLEKHVEHLSKNAAQAARNYTTTDAHVAQAADRVR